MDAHQPNATATKPQPGVNTRPGICKQHGEFTERNFIGNIWSGCPTCATEKAAASALREEAEKKARKDAARASRIGAMREESGLTGRMLDHGFDGYQPKTEKQTTALAACRAYVEEFKSGEFPPAWTLWLVGPPGTGKSHLGASMVNHLINNGMPARMHSMKGLLRLLRSTWNKDEAPTSATWETEEGGMVGGRVLTEDQVIHDIASCKLLVVDEIGMIFDSPADRVQLFEVLDARYNLRNPTVLLTNLNATEIKASLGDRLYDRLAEGASIKVVDGPSGRRDFPTRGGA